MWRRLTLLWQIVRGDGRVVWFALRHPQSPRWLKLVLLALAAFLLSPLNLALDMVPVIGVVDDILIIALALRLIVRALPASIREAARRG